MKQKFMLKYIISFFLVFLIQQNGVAQETETTEDNQTSSYYPKTYGLRLGIDIIKPILIYTEDDFEGGEITADFRLNTRWFVASEMGYANTTIDEDNFNHTVKGSYIKLGVNYNLYSNWLDMDNEIYIGARYGFSTFSNQLNSYTVFQEGEFFDPKEVNTPTKYSNLNTHWVEFVAGLKVEVLKNVYLGVMVNINALLTTKDPDNFENTYSPGFGDISDNGTGSNINYTISYRIPLYKK